MNPTLRALRTIALLAVVSSSALCQSTQPAVPPDLLAADAPEADAVNRLIDLLANPNILQREAAIRRLLPHAGVAAAPVARAFAEGKLATRLSALELLQAWGAPVDGIDPWLPASITPDRLKSITQWASSPKPPATRPAALDATQLATLRRDLAALTAATPAEALALRERLARLGPAILPEVLAQRQQAATDIARQRLTALRYRIVASDTLALTWPEGLDRLASADAQARQSAAQELAKRVSARDADLLMELFSDADPLVREIALKALQDVGGASESLVRLLHDPEPNVRAAVLKQLAEKPIVGMVPKIVEYVATEKDADLVVHAARALRVARGEPAARCLLGLLKHSAWQVRAEAAEALQEAAGKLQASTQADIYAEMVNVLEDSDGFVVSRAIATLQHADLLAALDPLIKTAARRPELAVEVVKAITDGSKMRNAAVPHLRKFCAHADAAVRAAAIGGLCRIGTDAAAELAATLQDGDSRVRLAAAEGLFAQITRLRPDDQTFRDRIQQQSSGFTIFGRSRTTTATIKGQDPEQWLAGFRSGEKREAWLNDVVAACRKMLENPSAEERLAAALPLVALGQDAQAMPVLRSLVKADPALAAKVAQALSWLPWEMRLAFFNELMPLARGEEAQGSIVRAMALLPARGAAEPVWGVLARPGATLEVADDVTSALRSIYFGDRYWNMDQLPASEREAAAAVARAKAESGPELQRTVALALLLTISQEAAAEAAAKVAADPAASVDLVLDATHIQLLGRGKPAATELALAAFQKPDPRFRKLGMAYLASGTSTLHSLRGSMYLYYSNRHSEGSYSSDNPPSLAAPAGLTAEMLKPFLAGADEEAAAQAGYLLCLLHDRAGLDPLTKLWRGKGSRDDEWRRLVFRAVAALNDDALVPVLEEVYRTWEKDSYEIREFYWTIRGMEGPNILRLRKQIRQDVGMDRLR